MKTYRELFKSYETICTKKKIDITSLKFLYNEILLSYNLHHITNANDKVNPKVEIMLSEKFKQLEKGLPVQYIIGYTYFYNLKIKVNKDVLIPRFDTEVLVELVLFDNQEESKKIVDVGTGSGCIAIALKKENENFEVIGIDISGGAIRVAETNAVENDVEIDFIQGDLLEPLIEQDTKVDIIVSNPPYIDINDKELADSVKLHEPHLALFSDEAGLSHIKDILEQSSSVLNEGGLIYLEIGHKQAKEVEKLIGQIIKEAVEVKVFKDMSGKDRVIRIKFI
jgi:release factor glutamine methyltransferase